MGCFLSAFHKTFSILKFSGLCLTWVEPVEVPQEQSCARGDTGCPATSSEPIILFLPEKTWEITPQMLRLREFSLSCPGSNPLISGHRGENPCGMRCQQHLVGTQSSSSHLCRALKPCGWGHGDMGQCWPRQGEELGSVLEGFSSLRDSLITC